MSGARKLPLFSNTVQQKKTSMELEHHKPLKEKQIYISYQYSTTPNLEGALILPY